MHRVAVFGLFGGTNFGNEASLEAALEQVRARRPEVEFRLISPAGTAVELGRSAQTRVALDPYPVRNRLWRVRPEPLRRVLGDVWTVATERTRVRHAMTALQGATLLWVPGTGVVDDFGQRAFDMPMQLARWTEAARALTVPVAFSAIGAQQVGSGMSRRWFRRALSTATERSFRDEESLRSAIVMGGASSSDRVVPDLAFGWSRLREAAPIRWPPRTVGVGLMNYRGWNASKPDAQRAHGRYVALMGRFARSLIESGFEVRWLIGDRAADLAVVPEVVRAAAAAAPGAAWLASAAAIAAGSVAETPASVVDEIRRCDVVVATRFHNLLFAAALGRPVLSVGYAPKNRALLESLGLGAYSHDLSALDFDQLRRSFDALAREPEELLRRLVAAAHGRRRILEDYFDAFTTRWLSGLKTSPAR